MFQFTQSSKKNISPKKGRKAEPVAVTIQRGVCSVMDFLLSVYLVLMIGVMPFYFEDGYAHIATDKMTFCSRVSILLWRVMAPVFAIFLLCSLISFLQEHRDGLKNALWQQVCSLVKGLSWTDRFTALYAVALVLSYLCSEYKEDALWGAGNGWFTGFLPQIMLALAYFFVTRFWKPRKAFFWLLLPVSAVVFLLGYLNRFSVYPIKMNMSSPSFISTIGNINWYCGYVVTLFFAGAALLWQGVGKSWQKGLLAGYVLLGFGTLVTQGSASGILALGVLLLFMFCMSAGDGLMMGRFWVTAFLLSVACLFTKLLRQAAPERMNFDDGVISLLTTGTLPMIMTVVSFALMMWIYVSNRKGSYQKKLFITGTKISVTLVSFLLAAFIVLTVINTMNPGSIGRLSEYAAFTFSDTWGSNRGATWKAGVMCFAEQNLLHKLVGVGPDAMAAFTYKDGSAKLVEMLNAVFGEYVRLTNAHNEWLTVLVNTGILGLIGFGGAMVTAIRTFLKRCGKDAIACACGVSLLAYTVNNIFSFQQTINLTTMMVILSMGMAFVREKEPGKR